MKKFTYQSIALLSLSFLLSGCGTSTSTSGVFSLAHTYLLRDDGNGGKIYQDSQFGRYSDVVSVANQYCNERRLGPATIGPNTLPSRVVQHYEFKCVSQVTPAPIQQNQIQSSPLVESMESAKKKCTDLGFKSGTEGFGKCVLQLSK